MHERIINDLVESRINWKLALLFIPVAFFTYLFHEFGHWIVGEILGNDMIISLNNVGPRSGFFIDESHALYSAMGGPAFSILQAMIFLLIIEKTKNLYVYPAVFFPAFVRFFSIVFGGFNMQDEAGISAMLDIGTYTTAIIVILLLFLLILRSSYVLKISLKANLYFFAISTMCILLVIETDKLLY
ncbi:MAG TPA: hypothetical protein VN370_02075 [Desulfitobacteriaceae bacterium]|nr:hypothetical protein [Desulfitobacteriaceae bacterium]